MRKFLLLIVSFLLIVPCTVNAKDYCEVISSTGKTAGSEVVCGTEHFYVVENKNNTVKMLAKYSLLVGDKIDYIEIEGERPQYTSTSTGAANLDCYNLVVQKGINAYYAYPMLGETDNGYELLGCRVYEKLNPEHIRQDERAIGTRLDGNGKSILPLYGITYMNPQWGYEKMVQNIDYRNEYDSNGNLIVAGTVFEGYLNGYKAELQRQGFAASDVSFITLDRIVNLLKEVSGKEVEVVLDYDDVNHNDPNPNPESVHIGKMNIKEYVPDNQKWIHSVTYWLGSGFKNENTIFNTYNDYYISNEGLLCALGRGECSYFAYPIGNGVRPLVTMSSSDIQFLIKTQTDGHGTIDVIDHALGGDSIKFKVNSSKGYKLDSVTIITDAGEKVEFREGKIQKNSDGTMSIDKNNFTMPFDNVTIQAKWKLDIANPNTGIETMFILMIILVSTVTMIVIMKRKRRGYVRV